MYLFYQKQSIYHQERPPDDLRGQEIHCPGPVAGQNVPSKNVPGHKTPDTTHLDKMSPINNVPCKNVTEQISPLQIRSESESNAEFSVKIRSLAALAFLSVQDVIMAFEELCEDDDIPVQLLQYFETNYVGEVRGRGRRRNRLAPTYPLELWNVRDRV